MTQVKTIVKTMPHLTALKRMTLPVPITAEEMTWVVDKGMPIAVDVWMTIDEVKSVANPLIGSIFIIRLPTVL
ncbi:MAG: hypothetical protein K0R75_3404, partial [Paenibacillaceae bacterium]|nr:hypothetical protein [Paenibacillaceae bacterium]